MTDEEMDRIAAERLAKLERGETQAIEVSLDELREQAAAPTPPAVEAEPVAWAHESESRDVISDKKKRDMIAHSGHGGRRLVALYTVPLYSAATLAAAVQRARAEEREACEQACDAIRKQWSGMGDGDAKLRASGAWECVQAIAIRARQP